MASSPSPSTCFATEATLNPQSAPLCKVFKPPRPGPSTVPSIFLAGSIEMGKAIDWQSTITDALTHLPISIFNPRRADWDPSWEQDISNPHFKEQVEWELDHIDKADLVVLYLQPGTLSPISLLELGLLAEKANVIVCCPAGFWRRGNVQVVCERHGIPLFEDFDKLVGSAVGRMQGLVDSRV